MQLLEAMVSVTRQTGGGLVHRSELAERYPDVMARNDQGNRYHTKQLQRRGYIEFVDHQGTYLVTEAAVRKVAEWSGR